MHHSPNSEGAPSICIVGGGNMGAAIARALTKGSISQLGRISIVERVSSTRESLVRESAHWCVVPCISEVPRQFQDLVILAVKPQDYQTLAPILQSNLGDRSIILSIMAGVSLNFLRQTLSGGSRMYVRAMPNLPAAIGEGVTAYYAESSSAESQIALVETIVSTLGSVVRVGSEDLVNAATALCGSGPAYLYYYLEQLAGIGKELGFTGHDAEHLAVETCRGALALLAARKVSAAKLREQVTSKGGTTAAAIAYFEQMNFGSILREGVKHAYTRAQELETECSTSDSQLN